MAKGTATDDLIGMVAEQAGISEDQAKKAVDAVWDFLDDKLPEPLAGQIDKVLAGGDISDLGGLGKSLGSMFGR
jgi:nucleoid DNA-binding protein